MTSRKLDAEVRIGQLMQSVPKADNGGANQYRAKAPAVGSKQTKREVIKESGFSKTQVQRIELS